MLQKRMATIQDISCLGKCSLAVAISVISAFGIEPAVIPTAILSTHTGAGFKDYTFKDLTDNMEDIITHWKKLNLSFDSMYSGYLGSISQIDIVEGFFKHFKTDDNIVFVDPVMGDHGKLYAGFDESFVKRMYSLCSKADVICPNLTEACYLTGTKYKENMSEDEAKDIALKLKKTGAKTIVITGITKDDKFGALCLDTKETAFYSYYKEKIPGLYYGTGDIFASVLSSALTKGKSLEKSLNMAIDFVYESILNTQDEKDKFYYGVKFEQLLSKLCENA